MKNAIIVFAVVLVILGGVYYFSQRYYTAPAQQDNSNTTAGTNSVIIQNFSFNPPDLTVKPGTTVIWTNNDSASHTIKSAGFNSGTLSKGQTFEFKFENAGSYDYACGIHPTMKGRITVE